MRSAALQHLESLLHARRLGNTLPDGWVTPPAAASTGDPDLDRTLGGGWRLGAISELVGPRSSGRTRVLTETMAAATGQGQVVALVDTLDRFDPVSAATTGLDLGRVLWVRGRAITAELARPSVLEQAVRQAIRAFDLILRAGGFAVVALDLADVPPRVLRAMPAATWLRLAHVNEGRPTAGLLVGESPMGRSARGVSWHLEPAPYWTGTSAQTRRFAGTRGPGSRVDDAGSPAAPGHRTPGHQVS
jgi:hypothetical protein